MTERVTGADEFDRPRRSDRRRRSRNGYRPNPESGIRPAPVGGPSSWWSAYKGLPTWQQVAFGLAAAFLVVLVLGSLVETALSVGRVHPGVTVVGVDVGGMTPTRAAETIDEEVGARIGEPVALVFEDRSWSVDSTTVAATLDTTAAVDAAMAVGRSGGFARSLHDRLWAYIRPVELDAPVDGDPIRTAALLDEVATEIEKAPQDAAVVIEGTEARIEPAVLGLGLERDMITRDMLAAFAKEERDVDVSVAFVPVSVTYADAEQALADAKKMMSAPAQVTYDADVWDLTPEEIAAWIRFRAVPANDATGPAGATADTVAAEADDEATDMAVRSEVTTDVPGPEHKVLEAFVSADEASATVTERVGSAGRPAQNATFKTSAGNVTIVPHQDGVGPDVEALALELTTVLKSDGERTVELRTQRVEPEITTEDAQAMGIKERFATYTTTYSSGNKPRVNNIHTLADAIDGTLLAPGETFSFNGTVGPRTAAKGYKEAPAIVSGQLVPQLGGGICQFGTTIFNTVFESGLPVVERKNHSFYISHYPKGRDATVSWGGPDFKFRNDTDNWVLIATGYTAGSVTVSLYGTDPGYAVSSETGDWYDVTSHPVKEVQDASMPAGSRVVEDSGVDGRKIVVTRTVKKGGSVVREDKFTSVYRPKAEIVRVGTLAPTTTSTPAATAP